MTDLPDKETLRERVELIVAEARLQFQVNLQMAETDGILSDEVLEHDKITEQVVVNQILALVYPENKEETP